MNLVIKGLDRAGDAASDLVAQLDRFTSELDGKDGARCQELAQHLVDDLSGIYLHLIALVRPDNGAM